MHKDVAIIEVHFLPDTSLMTLEEIRDSIYSHVWDLVQPHGVPDVRITRRGGETLSVEGLADKAVNENANFMDAIRQYRRDVEVDYDFHPGLREAKDACDAAVRRAK